MTEDKSNPAAAPLRDVIRHLVHEMRQPLSGIESLSYYLSLVLGDDDELSAHCARLRRLVHQANWSLEDASFAACCLPQPFEPVNFNSVLRALADEYDGNSDAPLTLALADGDPVAMMPRSAGPRLMEHLLGVFRDIAVSERPPLFTTSVAGQAVQVTVDGEVNDTAMSDVLRAVDPAGAPGGVARLAAALNGAWSVEVDSNRVRLQLTLPAASRRSEAAIEEESTELSEKA